MFSSRRGFARRLSPLRAAASGREQRGTRSPCTRRAFGSFARTWGVFHVVPRIPQNPADQWHLAPPSVVRQQSLADWTALANHLDDMLRRLVPSEEPTGLDSRERRELRERAGRDVLNPVECWTQAASIRVKPSFDDGVALLLEGVGLMGLLGVELPRAYLQPELIAICVECRSPHVAARQTAESRLNFCDEHRGKSKLRNAKYLAKKRMASAD